MGEHGRRPRAVRAEGAQAIIDEFIVSSAPQPLPAEVMEALRDRPLDSDLSHQRLFRVPARVSFALLTDEYRAFCQSDDFDVYHKAMKAERGKTFSQDREAEY